jgi:hypothetical protein
MDELQLVVGPSAKQAQADPIAARGHGRAASALAAYAICMSALTACLIAESRRLPSPYIAIDDLDGKVGELRSVSDLEFLHIPKTAGTSIEDFGHKELVRSCVRWIFDLLLVFLLNDNFIYCFTQGVAWGRFNYVASNKGKCGISAWHDPEQHFNDHKEIFCVVRDPIERWVRVHSKYYGSMVALRWQV